MEAIWLYRIHRKPFAHHFHYKALDKDVDGGHSMARASTIYMLPEFLLQKLFIPLTCLFYCIMTVTCVIPNSKLSQRRLPNEIQLRQLDLPCAWSSTGPLCDNTSQV